MIRTLQVFDLAVIEQISLELGPGLNVVTGETGAGKSILLGALALLRGGRISSDLVRTGAKEARVEAILDDPVLLARAREHGLATEDDQELVISRTVSREGRGRIRVNGSLATATVLERVTGEGVEVVGQGEHQQILRADVQAAMLDRFAGVEAEVDTVSQLYRRWAELGRAIAEGRSNAEARLREEDRLRFEIEQIRTVDPRPGAIEELTRQTRGDPFTPAPGERKFTAGELAGLGVIARRLAAEAVCLAKLLEAETRKATEGGGDAS